MRLEGLDEDLRRRLMAVAAVNVAMFVLAVSAGRAAGSQALQADALDFLAHGASYGLALWAVGKPAAQRGLAELIRAGALLALGAWIGLATIYQFFVRGVPEAEIIGLIGLVALGANGLTLYLLQAQRSDGPLRAVWLTARNDLIGTGAVVVAAGLVAVMDSGAPDLIVGGVLVALFVTGAVQAFRTSLAAWQEQRSGAT